MYLSICIWYDLFVIREVNSDMPIYIKQNKCRKNQMPRAELNPRHLDLMTGALTTELPRHPQQSDQLQRKHRFPDIYAQAVLGELSQQALLLTSRQNSPGTTGDEAAFVGRRDLLIGPDVKDIPYDLVTVKNVFPSQYYVTSRRNFNK